MSDYAYGVRLRHRCVSTIVDCSVSCYTSPMTITQTVDIPADYRLTIDVPREVPVGPVVLTFTPVAETESIEFLNASATEVLTAGDKILDTHLAAFKALAK